MKYTFYWGDVPENFGDVLTRNILNYFNIDFTHTNNHRVGNMFATGSIARLATPGSTVIGSGMIRKGEEANPLVKWRSVRGPLTRANVIRCGGECPEIYGDPALMLPLFCEPSEKKHKVGLIPHYQDYRKVKSMYPNHHVIDLVSKDPLRVAREISSCEKVISSSLHGIIASHAYGIPAARVVFSRLHGDGSKFEDYAASVDVSPEVSTVDKPIYTTGTIPDLQPLIDIFKSL
jgi:pyruvyltransferase